MMESLLATLKKERIHQEDYTTRAEAAVSVFESIQRFYNRLNSKATKRNPLTWNEKDFIRDSQRRSMMRGAFADGGTVESRRKKLGLTQEQLAKRASCNVKTVRKAEKGGNLDLATLRLIATALGVSTADIAQRANRSRNNETENLQAALAWLDAFNRRDVEGMLAVFHEDAVRHIPGTEGIPSGGSFQGTEELRRHFEEAFRVFDTEYVSRNRVDIDAVGDFVFLRACAGVVHIPTGRREECYVIQEFRFRDGKVAEMLTVTDTLAFHRLTEGDEPVSKC